MNKIEIINPEIHGEDYSDLIHFLNERGFNWDSGKVAPLPSKEGEQWKKPTQKQIHDRIFAARNVTHKQQFEMLVEAIKLGFITTIKNEHNEGI